MLFNIYVIHKTGEFQHNSFHWETASQVTIRLCVCVMYALHRYVLCHISPIFV